MLAGCAAKKASPWGDPQTGLILQYRMAEDQVLKYQTSAEQTQDIEVMGQAMTTETTSSSSFTVKPKGLKENNHLLHVTIDSMSVDISSPQGDLSPDLSSVIGESFEMVLSPLGKELDVFPMRHPYSMTSARPAVGVLKRIFKPCSLIWRVNP